MIKSNYVYTSNLLNLFFFRLAHTLKRNDKIKKVVWKSEKWKMIIECMCLFCTHWTQTIDSSLNLIMGEGTKYAYTNIFSLFQINGFYNIVPLSFFLSFVYNIVYLFFIYSKYITYPSPFMPFLYFFNYSLSFVFNRHHH